MRLQALRGSPDAAVAPGLVSVIVVAVTTACHAVPVVALVAAALPAVAITAVATPLLAVDATAKQASLPAIPTTA